MSKTNVPCDLLRGNIVICSIFTPSFPTVLWFIPSCWLTESTGQTVYRDRFLKNPQLMFFLGYNTLGRSSSADKDIDMLKYYLKWGHIRTHLKQILTRALSVQCLLNSHSE